MTDPDSHEDQKLMTDTKSLQERLGERLELEPRAAAIMVDLSLLREAVLELDTQAKLIAEAREVLEPFASEARRIAQQNPGWDYDDFQLRVGGRPSKLGPYRRAAALLTKLEQS